MYKITDDERMVIEMNRQEIDACTKEKSKKRESNIIKMSKEEEKQIRNYWANLSLDDRISLFKQGRYKFSEIIELTRYYIDMEDYYGTLV